MPRRLKHECQVITMDCMVRHLVTLFGAWSSMLHDRLQPRARPTYQFRVWYGGNEYQLKYVFLLLVAFKFMTITDLSNRAGMPCSGCGTSVLQVLSSLRGLLRCMTESGMTMWDEIRSSAKSDLLTSSNIAISDCGSMRSLAFLS